MKTSFGKLPKEKQKEIIKLLDSDEKYLPIDFMEWYSGTTKERIIEMYKSWKKNQTAY
jgi:hypothetical protein